MVGPGVCWRTLGRRAAGLACLAGVVLIWVVSGELIEYIFVGASFNAPFALTYFNTSLFSLYLLGFLVRPRWWGPDGPPWWLPWLRAPCCAPAPAPPCGELPKHESEDLDDAAPIEAEPPPMKSVGDVAWIALGFCPLWFGANYLYNLSLSLTSVASATILSTTSSLFTFALSCALCIEKPTVWKLVGLLLMMAGVVLVSLVDSGASGPRESVIGDVLAVLGAIFYAAYAVYLKMRLDERAVHMPMFFGFVGLINMLLLWPLGVIVHVVGWESLSGLSGPVVGYLWANALVGTVISDYLWVLAVLLVSPVVATAGLALTIPLSMLADVALHGQAFHALYVVGAVLTILGFILVNVSPAEVLRALRERFTRTGASAAPRNSS